MRLPDISGVANMEFFGTRLFAMILWTVFVTAPMILWVSLWAVAKTSSINLCAILPWLKLLRWVAWSFAMVLFLIALVGDHFQHFPIYAIAISTFSVGLSLPEGWLKRKIVQPV
jgi:hypothetical protein